MALLTIFTSALFFLVGISAAVPQSQSSRPPNNPPANELFNLQPQITAVTTEHTGAGTSAAIAVTNQTIAGVFSLNNTYLGLRGGTPPEPYTFGLLPSPAFRSTAPQSYNIVVVNGGLYTAGFSFDPGNYVRFSGSNGFTTFALCSVNGTAPYFSLGLL
ncbi:MAG: hypothetical protein Q9162_006669 [Coniocarpon cinnabarinum]